MAHIYYAKKPYMIVVMADTFFEESDRAGHE